MIAAHDFGHTGFGLVTPLRLARDRINPRGKAGDDP